MKLFAPIKIGTLIVRNRIVMPAMSTGFASEDGQVTERMIKYYEERAKGGVGLIIVEFTGIERRGWAGPSRLRIDDDRFIPGLKKLATAIKKHGARAAIQLQHSGVKASAQMTQIQPVGPSVFDDYPARMGPAPRALNIGEIHNLVLAFGEAAQRAKNAGFNAIELHFTHSYLIDQFMSPRFNHRADIYGGSIENRARFACEIIEYIKEKLGENYPIICRMTGDDYVEGGIRIDDAIVSAGLLVKSGANCLHISVGISDNMVSTPSMLIQRGCFVHLAEKIKKVVDVPVIAVGRINEPAFAKEILAEQKADLVAMGRSLIADPFLPEKAKKGDFDNIAPCIFCNQGCISRAKNGLPITCLVNPNVGREGEFKIEPVRAPKKVLVVGGGPAGLKVALVASERGHHVVLAEKKGRLGGQLNYACKPPNKEIIKILIDYFCRQIRKSKVKTYLNKEVTKEFVHKIKPDVIVLATGATFSIPKIHGVDGENVFLATDILDLKNLLSKRAIVIGGGLVGLETADFLAEAGQEVTVLEMLSEVGLDMPPRNKMFFMKKMSEKKIRILVNREIKEVTKKGVRADHFGQQENFTGDIVVLAVGSKSERTLLEGLQEMIPELEGFYIAGDCIEPRSALEAIYEGARIAKEI